MFCPFCGTDNAADQRYCRNCGASLPTNTAKSTTKPHSAVGSGGSRASGPFVPPQPPNLPGRKGKNLSPTDPYATSVSAALPEDAMGVPSNSTADFARPEGSGGDDSFFETQVSFPVDPSKKSKGQSSDMQTIEMGSLRSPLPSGGEEEDMRSTSLAMAVVKVPPKGGNQSANFMVGDEEEDMRSTSLAMSVVKLPTAPPPPPPPPPSLPSHLQKSMSPPPAPPVAAPPTMMSSASSDEPPSEEYFPTLLAGKAPPSSREEQLKMLNDIMEAENKGGPGGGDQTLSMGAVKPKRDQLPSMKTDEFATPGNRPTPPPEPKAPLPYDQTMRAGSMNKVDSFQQTLAGGSAQLGGTGGKKKEDAFPGGMVPETLTMRGPVRAEAKEEPFSYPNMEDNSAAQDNSFGDISSDTLMITPPPKKQITMPEGMSADTTNPWGTPPKPEDFVNLGKTEALSPQFEKNQIPDQPLSEEDPFRTTAVPFIPTKGKKKPSNEQDPLQTAVNTPAYKDDRTSPASPPPMVASPPSLTSSNPLSSQPTVISQPPVATPPDRDGVISEGENEAPASSSKSFLIPIIILIFLVLTIVGIYGVWRFFFHTVPVKVTTPVANVSPKPTNNVPPPPVVPTNMILVPAGEFVIGCDEGLPGCEQKDKASSPAHTARLDAFYLDTYEVTNEEYAKFIKATNHRKPIGWNEDGTFPGDAKSPVVNVSWDDAKAFAEWAGKRLPTEEEWEVAAGGKDHFVYPWGNQPDTKRSNTDEYKAGGVLSVGKLQEGKSPLGFFDMSGNVWEWTSSVAEPYPNATDFLSLENPEQNRVIRGGSYKDKLKFCTTVYRGFVVTNTTNPVLGFRCAKDAPQPSK